MQKEVFIDNNNISSISVNGNNHKIVEAIYDGYDCECDEYDYLTLYAYIANIANEEITNNNADENESNYTTYGFKKRSASYYLIDMFNIAMEMDKSLEVVIDFDGNYTKYCFINDDDLAHRDKRPRTV